MAGRLAKGLKQSIGAARGGEEAEAEVIEVVELEPEDIEVAPEDALEVAEAADEDAEPEAASDGEVDVEELDGDVESEDTDEDADEEDEDDEEDSEDSLTYSNGVIEKIVAMATREVPHVLGMKGNFFHAVQAQFGVESLTKGVTVEVTDDNRVIVNISVIIEYGAYAPDIFEDVKERVTERLASMTGLEVAGINLRIEDVVTPEEYGASQSSAE